MTQLSGREKRLVKWAAILIPAYLVFFYGLSGISALEEKRREYVGLELAAQDVQIAVTKELKKRKQLATLREEWRLELDQLDVSTLVSEARDAITQAAGKCGIGLGASQETGRGSNAEQLRVVQLQGSGPTDKVLRFLHVCPRLGFPVLVDNLQIKGMKGKPGMLTFSCSISILNISKWKGSDA